MSTTGRKSGWVTGTVAPSTRRFAVNDRQPNLASRGDTFSSWTAGSFGFVALALLIPTIVSGLTPSQLLHMPVFLAYLLLCYSAAHLAQLFKNGSEAVTQICVWLFVYVFLALPALSELIHHQLPIPGQSFSVSVESAAIVNLLLGVVALDLGGWVFRRRVPNRRQGVHRSLEHLIVSPSRTWILSVFGLAATSYLTLKYGGLTGRFTSQVEIHQALFGHAIANPALARSLDKSTGSIKLELISAPIFIGFLLLVYLRREARRREADRGMPKGRRTPLVTSTAATWFAAIMAVGVFIGNNPITGGRFKFGVVSISVALVLLDLRRQGKLRIAMASLLGLLLIVFPYASYFRNPGAKSLRITAITTPLISSPDYGMFQQEMNGQVYVRTHGFREGRQIEGTLLFFVPRSIWHGKPIDTGSLISRVTFINASSSLWTEAFVDGGVVGIIIVFIGYGGLIHYLDDAYLRRRQSSYRSVIGVYIPVFAASQFALLRGDLLSTWADLLTLSLFILATVVRARIPTRPVRPS